MEHNFGNLQIFDLKYLEATPLVSPFRTIDEAEIWRTFLRDIMVALCATDPVTILCGNPELSPGWSWYSPHMVAHAPCGAPYTVHELSSITEQQVEDDLINSEQFGWTSCLFFWKPKGPIQPQRLRAILEWRDAMFFQPIPFSHIVATGECIGFPIDDGNRLIWLNPDCSIEKSESITRVRGVNWNTSGNTRDKETDIKIDSRSGK